jgi:transposase InsO family protein
LYLILDIFSRYIIHWEIHLRESKEHAKKLVKKAVFKHGVLNQPIVLHSDNGAPMKAKDFQNLLIDLGITRSYSRPRVSNDNPYSESLFRTLKYSKTFPWKGFSSIESARAWVHEFVKIYNTKSLHSSIKYVTPEQRHYGKDVEILAKRNEVYRLAKLNNPSRWSSDTRDWSRPDTVTLNPEKEDNVNVVKKMRQLT